VNDLETWLNEQGKLTEQSKATLKGLLEEAQFALYCQRGGGSCMGNFGNKVASYAIAIKVDGAQLLSRLMAQASEEVRKNNWDI
jgi:hypothetical protein